MKKSSRVISTLLLGATLTTMSANVFAVESPETIKTKVLAGESRYETAIEVSKHGWKSADTVVLVNAYAIPDALAATPMAKMNDAPILLTEANTLTASTKAELQRLQTKNVIVVGGEGVVSNEVVKALKDMKIRVDRVAGVDRIATALAVADEVNAKEVAVVNGYDGLADALSVAAPAAQNGMAIVLSTKDDLRATGNYIKDNNIEKAYVIGGTGVVSNEVANELPQVERLGGANRQQTNAKVLEKFYSQDELKNVYVAKDGNPNESELVDALAVGPLAGSNGSPVVLAGANLSSDQEAYAKARTASEVTEVGYGVNQNTINALIKALEVKDVTTDNENPQVTSITALNTDQFEIKFDQKVDMASAENLENYSVKNSDAEQILIKSGENRGKAEVQEDGQTVILTLRQQYGNETVNGNNFSYYNTNQKDLKVKVENVLTKSKNAFFPKYEKEVNVFDQNLPELKSINQVGPKEFDLIFSEPVTADTRNDITSAIRINNGQYGFNAQTRIENKDIAPNAVRLSTTDNLDDGQYNLTIKGDKIYNYAKLKLNKVSTTFNAEKNTAPVTMKVDEYTADTVTIKFDKEVKNEENYWYENGDKSETPVNVGDNTTGYTQVGNSNVSYYLDYVNNDAFKAYAAKKEDGKLKVYFANPIPAGEHKIIVDYNSSTQDKIEDLWGNLLNPLSVDFTVAKDTVAPTVTAVYNKDKGKIELKFSKDVVVSDAENVSYYELRNNKGKYINISSITQKDKNNERDYLINIGENLQDDELNGTYTLTVKGDKIHDTTVERNTVAATTLTLDQIDNTPASVTRLVYGGENNRKILVQYSEGMKTEGQGSILDMDLYTITYTPNGESSKVTKRLSDIKDAKIEEGRDNTSAIITLPNTNEAEKAQVAIGGVSDLNGNIANASGTDILTVQSTPTTGVVTGVLYGVGATNDVAQNDANIVALTGYNGGSLGIDTDVLDAGSNAKIISNDEMAVYVLGDITAASNISVTSDGKNLGAIDKVTPQASMEKLYFTSNGTSYEKDAVVTKLIIKFKNDQFKESVPKNMVVSFANQSLTTSLGTNTTAANVNISNIGNDNTAAAEYVDGSAQFITVNGLATGFTFQTTKALQPGVVSKFTFKVDGYTSDNIASATSDGNTVTIKFKSDAYRNVGTNPKVEVTQANAVQDVNGNEVTGMNFFIEKVEATPIGVTLGQVETTTPGVAKTEGTKGTPEVITITVDGKASKAGEITVQGQQVTLKGTEDTNQVAQEIAAAFGTNPTWTAVPNGNIVTLTAKVAAKNVQAEQSVLGDTGVNSVTGEVTTPGVAPVKGTEGTKGVFTVTVTKGASNSGNITVVVDNTINVQVPVKSGDDANAVATAIITALKANDQVNAKYAVSGSDANVVLTQNTPSATNATIALQ